MWFDSPALFNGSLKFTLGNASEINPDSTFQVEIPNEELMRPLRGIARNGTRLQNDSVLELGVYRDEVLFDSAVLGEETKVSGYVL